MRIGSSTSVASTPPTIELPPGMEVVQGGVYLDFDRIRLAVPIVLRTREPKLREYSPEVFEKLASLPRVPDESDDAELAS